MAITRDFIDDLVQRTDIVSLIGTRVRLHASGSNHKGLCPFHDEKTPSFIVNGEKQFFHCFGCNVSGDVINFLRTYHNIEFLEAIRMLAKLHGVSLPRSNVQSSGQSGLWKQSLALVRQVAELYRSHLRIHQYAAQAQMYLEKRGIDKTTTETFAFGFAPPERNMLCRTLQENSNNFTLAKELGLIKHNDKAAYDQFRNRIIFPIRDSQGRVRGFGGRVLGDQQPKYLNSSESAIFHKSEVLYGLYESLQQRSKQNWLVVEGYIDVAMLFQHGFHKVVACLGTTINERQIALLTRSDSTICFAFDGDEAGKRAAEKTMKICLSMVTDEREFRFAFLPAGEDPASYIASHGAQRMKRLLTEDARPLSDMFIHWLGQQASISTVEGKAKIAAIGQKELRNVPRGYFQQLLTQQIRELTSTGRYERKKNSIPSVRAEKLHYEAGRDTFHFLCLAIGNRADFIADGYLARLTQLSALLPELPMQFFKALATDTDKDIAVLMMEHLTEQQIDRVRQYQTEGQDEQGNAHMRRLFARIEKRGYDTLNDEQKRQYIKNTYRQPLN